MLPFKKIICPTDFSEVAYEAVRTAGEMAYYFDAELCILNVIAPVPVVPVGGEPMTINPVSYDQEVEASAQKALEDAVSRLEWRGLRIRLILLRGNPAEEIVRTAEEENADLIVIATRGRTGLDRFLLGSVAEKVVRLAECPVLTVSKHPAVEEKEIVSEENEEKKITDDKTEGRKAYREKIKEQLQHWGERIDELRIRVENSGTAARKKYEEPLKEMQRKKESLQKKLTELKESGEETWERSKSDIEEGLGELKDLFNQRILTFKDKGKELADGVSKKKKVFLERAEAEAREWSAQIEVLKAKADKAKGKIQLKYLDRIEELKNKQETLKSKLEALRQSGGEAWEEFRGGVEEAVTDLKKAFRRGASKFKKE